MNPADWSLPARALVSVAALAAAAGLIWLILGVGGRSAADTGPASMVTTAPNPEALAASRVTSIIADPNRTGSGSSAQLAPPLSSAQAAASSIPLIFGEQDIAGAGAVATAWISGIATIRWDEDQQVRTDRLRAYLADDQDPALTQWVAPSNTTLSDLSGSHAALTGTATVDQVVTVARGSILLQVTLTQTSVRDNTPSKTATSSYVVTVVPRGGTWLVSAMIGAADGDPGY